MSIKYLTKNMDLIGLCRLSPNCVHSFIKTYFHSNKSNKKAKDTWTELKSAALRLTAKPLEGLKAYLLAKPIKM
jgi:hypothetical protein